MAFILALSLPDRNVYTALAADTKDVANASPTDTCFETDTGDEYEFNGAEWKKIGTTTSSGESAGLVVVSSEPARDIIDNNADGFTQFGSAPYGSAEADAAWVVERQLNGSPDEFVVSAPNQVWDDRLTLTYNNGVA